MVDDFQRKKGVTLVKRDEVSARWMANLIAVQQAIKKVDAKKIISFHSRIRLADEFAKNEPRGIAYHLRDYEVRHVNGEQSSGERRESIQAFADAKKGLLTNVRCLTEGIDVPAVDMIAFIDPRQGKVDITQAVGRAMRKPRHGPTTKKFGYVVVPVFVDKNKDDEQSAIHNEGFEAVVDVFNAMQEHDEDLVDIIHEIRERKGAGKPFNPQRLNGKLAVIGPRVGLAELTRSIEVEIANRIGNNWDEWVGLLRRFKAREGHCDVPGKHREGILRLGGWVGLQRMNRNTMSADRRQRLDAIGFIWDAPESWWDEGFRVLQRFKEREGHCNVPAKHREGTYQLGTWVGTQRTKKDTMSADRRQRLDEIGFVWDPLEAKWEDGFSALKRFKAREGHCLAPYKHREGTYPLGNWVMNQRQRTNKDTMSAEHRQRLDEIGFIWDPYESEWEKGFAILKQFKEREGHCNVLQRHHEGTFRLGGWVSVQRTSKDTMSAEHRQRLNEIGFVWDVLESKWEDGFAVLKQFKAREGHCNVSQLHIEGTYRLGTWVSSQRMRKDAMSNERRQRLDKIGFVWARKL
jgi:Helicase associated domain/Helicase conserved C-terminal domain